MVHLFFLFLSYFHIYSQIFFNEFYDLLFHLVFISFILITIYCFFAFFYHSFLSPFLAFLFFFPVSSFLLHFSLFYIFFFLFRFFIPSFLYSIFLFFVPSCFFVHLFHPFANIFLHLPYKLYHRLLFSCYISPHVFFLRFVSTCRSYGIASVSCGAQVSSFSQFSCLSLSLSLSLVSWHSAARADSL